MVYIVMKGVAPSHKAMEVAQKAMVEGPKFQPQFEALNKLGKSILVSAAKFTFNGGELLSVFEPSEGNLEAALKIWHEWLGKFMSIEGVGGTIDVYYTLDEILAFTGAQKPA